MVNCICVLVYQPGAGEVLPLGPIARRRHKAQSRRAKRPADGACIPESFFPDGGVVCGKRLVQHCWLSRCLDEKDPFLVTSGAITQITPEQLENMVAAMAMSDTEYLMVAETNSMVSHRTMLELILATSEFLQAVAFYDPVTAAHLTLPSSQCSSSLLGCACS